MGSPWLLYRIPSEGHAHRITNAIQQWITDINPQPPEEVIAQTSLLLERIGMKLAQER